LYQRDYLYIYLHLFYTLNYNHDEGSAKKYKGMNDSKQNGMDLLQRHFEMSPVYDKFWTIEDVIHIN